MTQDNSQEIPLLTFNSLYNILREEKKNKSLKSLPEKFYEALEKFLSEKKKEIEKLKQQQNLEKLKKERTIYRNSQKISKEIINIRCTKISNIAIKNILFEDEILSEKEILEKEKTFLNDVKQAISKFNK